MAVKTQTPADMDPDRALEDEQLHQDEPGAEALVTGPVRVDVASIRAEAPDADPKATRQLVLPAATGDPKATQRLRVVDPSQYELEAASPDAQQRRRDGKLAVGPVGAPDSPPALSPLRQWMRSHRAAVMGAGITLAIVVLVASIVGIGRAQRARAAQRLHARPGKRRNQLHVHRRWAAHARRCLCGNTAPAAPIPRNIGDFRL